MLRLSILVLFLGGCAHACPALYDENQPSIEYLQGYEDHRRDACAWKEAFEAMRDDRDRWLNEIYEINGQNYAEGAGDADYEIKFIINGHDVQCSRP